MSTGSPSALGSQPSGSGSAGPPGSQRKERGAIAAQACETCRNRKQKCDEQRPRCGTCQKFKLDCQYREVQPTKKDKTMVEILERIKSLEDDRGTLSRIESKLDSLSLREALPPSAYGTAHPTSLLALPPPSLGSTSLGPLPHTHFSVPGHTATLSDRPAYKYVSSVSHMLAWPVVQQLLIAVASETPGLRPATIERDGPSIFLGIRDKSLAFPPAPPASSLIRAQGRSNALQNQLASSMSLGNWQPLADAYFDTFNCIHPILDRQLFHDEVLLRVLSDGIDYGINSTLACLVFALGEVAIAGTRGPPLDLYNTRPSGMKGGSLAEPPGLGFFNEARKRMGFNLTDCSLENVQAFLLASLYYGTNSNHLEFWRMTISASQACQALILGKSIDPTDPKGDLLKRAFCHCLVMETCLNLEFHFPLTGLEKLEGLVGLPDFGAMAAQEDYVANNVSHFQEHFLSQIALRRLLVDFQGRLSQDTTTMHGLSTTSVVDQSTTTQAAIQLEQWRGLLPAQLRWDEDHPAAASGPNPNHEMFGNSPMFASGSASPAHVMFTTDLDTPPATYPYASDMLTALLRTRYYFTKYLLFRPFVYKAVHFPDQMTEMDAQGVVQCLQAALKWPLTMSPPSRHKRLVPCLFFWSQNLLGVLILLHLSQQVPILLRIRSSMCGDQFDMDAGETVGLYLDWIRDLRNVDPAARWCWEVIKVVYRIDDDHDE